MSNKISGAPSTTLAAEHTAIGNDPKMNDAQKHVVMHAADLLAEPGGYAKLNKADQAAVQAGDQVFNQTHGTNINHSGSVPVQSGSTGSNITANPKSGGGYVPAPGSGGAPGTAPVGQS